jgi:hypothetical protein
MVFALPFILAAAAVQAPSITQPAREAKVTALGQAVAVILPAVTNEAGDSPNGAAGAFHRRAVQEPRGASIVFE